MNSILKKTDLIPFLNSLKRKFKVIVPVENELGASCFSEFNGQEIFLRTRTDFSPKKFFTPPQEKMFFFRKKTNSYDLQRIFDEKPKVLFGIRPCDTHALHVLDELFIRFCGEDTYYSERRKNTLLVALQCSKACSNGFCTSLGTSQPIGHDVLFIERGNDFFVTAASKAGEQLIDCKFFKPTRDAPPGPKIACEKELLTHNLEENLYENFNHPVWGREAERELNCTACTQVCPTCYCYYSEDQFEFGSSSSTRSRQQDSCHLLRFTQVAGNKVFRSSRQARLRQFVLHKLSYYKKDRGLQLCTGCGRCIDACPVKIDLTKIANEIQRHAGQVGK